jgi:2-polyprenyl-3-methyl-5-hydroxy-6-metoxy-1,4-benzoquinol methylase
MDGICLSHENVYGHKKRLEFIISNIRGFANSNKISILDIGCGTGCFITLPIAQLGYTIVGLDLDKSSIDTANELNIFPNAKFLCQRIEDLPADEKFDIIICSEVLEHLQNPQELLFSMARHLKSDGMLLVTVPNGYGPFEMEQLIFVRTGIIRLGRIIKCATLKAIKHNVVGTKFVMTNDESGHIHFFTLGQIRSLAESGNFKILIVEKSSFLAGHVTKLLIGWSQTLVNIDVNVIPSLLPSQLCSGWYFVMRFK